VRGMRRVVPLLAATGISVSGDGAFIAAAPLLAAALTRDPVAVSTVTAAFYVPWLIAGLPAGALVDRWNRRRVMVIADLVRAGALAALAALVVTGWVPLPLLVTTVLIVGVAQCFFDSAAQAVIPAAVGRDKDALAHVNGRFWALDTIGRSLLGPPLGSGTFALARVLPFALDSLSFVISAVLVRMLPAVPAKNGPHESIGSAIRSGLRHLLHTRELLVLSLGLGAFNAAFNIVMATFVLYTSEVLRLPDAAYGLLLAATALGGVAASWQARRLTRRLSYRQTLSLAILVNAMVWGGIVLTANVWVTAALLALQGAAAAMSSVAVGSARQALTPDDLLGRVVSAFRLFGVGAAALGALLGGGLAHTFGLHAPFIAAMSLLFVSTVLTWPSDRH